MSGFQRNIGARAIRHADPDSKTHQEDVARNNERRSLYWLGVEQQIEDRHRVLPELGSGILFVRDQGNGDLLLVDGAEHTQMMNRWAAELSYYLREIKDKKCKDGKRWKKTPTKGIQGNVVSAAPWWSNLLYEAAGQGEAEKVRELATQAAVELAHQFQKQTRRRVVSVQAHFDTTSVHWHVFSTRIGEDHKLIQGTAKAIGLIGPWAVGVLRQAEAGAIPRDSTNVRVAQRLYTRNENRMGSAPVDYTMAKCVDQICSAMFGVSPRLSYWLRIYRSGFVGLCVDRLLALRDAADREAMVWQHQGQDYAPSEVGFGGGVNGGMEITLK